MIVGISRGPAPERNGARRGVHLVSLAASTVLHASIVAAVICNVLGASVSLPEPLVVELVSEVGNSGRAGGTTSGGQDATGAAPGESRQDAAERAPVEADHAVQQSQKASTVEPEPPVSRPRTVVKESRSVAKKVPQVPRQPRPAAPAAATSPAPVAEPAMPTKDAEPPSDNSLRQGDPLVAALGADGAGGAGGAARAAGGAGGDGGRPNGHHGSGAKGNGSTRGAGFSLGSAGNPMPSYPPAARRRGIEGRVVLDVLVSAEGQALSVEIARSSGS
ncbi:MAG TPA: TonB family protein, partial [Candidatus Defluviicoccus seviourii]|nr:TonB family protein [Candidatus Defluviicoccus seviourii]